ncbi:MAG: hypothetical protein P8J87_06740, partial [Verrucomicrobiales bacterium]|nr:hypothetical protein [Verrucomicrobiales bacterium]
PRFAHVGTSRDDRRLIIIRVDAAATGTDTFTFSRDGTSSTVRINYLDADGYLVLQDDVFTVGGTGSTIEFNPLLNDQGAGYLAPVNIAPTLNIDEPATAFYFRHRFDAGNLSGPSPLSIDFLRDDGIVVYLNGTELFRDNMPSGAVTPDSLAENAIGGGDESSYNSRNINATLLPGENTIAVEVHQASTTSSDLGFDLSLASRGLTLIPRDSDWRFLDNGGSPDPASTWKSNVYDPGNFTTTSFGPDSSDKHITTYFRTTFELTDPETFPAYTANIRVDDGAVVYINGQEAFRENMPAGTVNFNTTSSRGASNNGTNLAPHTVASDLLVAGTNSIAVEVHQTASTSSDTVLDLELTAGATTILPLNANWRYSDTGTDLGTAWRTPAFDDSTWPASTAPLGYPARGVIWSSGTAIFGFGDGLETTPVNSGATGLALLPGAFRIISATNLTPAKGNLDTSATIPVTINGRRQDVFTGDLKFTPSNNASGIATIEYTAEDGAGNRRTGTVSVVLPLVEIT